MHKNQDSLVPAQEDCFKYMNSWVPVCVCQLCGSGDVLRHGTVDSVQEKGVGRLYKPSSSLSMVTEKAVGRGR